MSFYKNNKNEYDSPKNMAAYFPNAAVTSYILRKTIEGYLALVLFQTFNTIKTLLRTYATKYFPC